MKEESDHFDYSCPTCDRVLPWRPEAAGRPVNCNCGATLTIPYSPGPALSRIEPTAPPVSKYTPTQTPDDETGEEVQLCPDCGARMELETIACLQCGWRRPWAKRRFFHRRKNAALPKPAAEHWSELTISPLRDVGLPVVLVAIGLVIEMSLLSATAPGHAWHDAVAAAPLMALLLVATVGAAFAIALALVPLLEFSLGQPSLLALKLAAAVVAPDVAGAVCYQWFGQGVSGLIVGWLASLILYLILFRFLFEFDGPDTLVLIALVCGAQAAMLAAVLWPLSEGWNAAARLWPVFAPVMIQSGISFVLAGSLVVPHVGEA